MTLRITGPTQVAFQPLAASVIIDRITIDLVSNTIVCQYHDPANASAYKQMSGAIPPALMAALQAQLTALVEKQEGWAAGTSKVG